jgi:hypothetical protein
MEHKTVLETNYEKSSRFVAKKENVTNGEKHTAEQAR